MKLSIILILLGILGIVSTLIYKSIMKTVMFIGPKSLTAFIICGILIIIGVWFLVIGK
jgi:hypothetical protein